MNCHEDNKGNQNGHKHNPMKHMLHMIICCGLPIVVVALLPIISRVSPSASTAISKIVPFLCPIMMLTMLPMMFGGNHKANCCDNKNSDVNNKELSN